MKLPVASVISSRPRWPSVLFTGGAPRGAIERTGGGFEQSDQRTERQRHGPRGSVRAIEHGEPSEGGGSDGASRHRADPADPAPEPVSAGRRTRPSGDQEERAPRRQSAAVAALMRGSPTRSTSPAAKRRTWMTSSSRAGARPVRTRDLCRRRAARHPPEPHRQPHRRRHFPLPPLKTNAASRIRFLSQRNDRGGHLPDRLA